MTDLGLPPLRRWPLNVQASAVWLPCLLAALMTPAMIGLEVWLISEGGLLLKGTGLILVMLHVEGAWQVTARLAKVAGDVVRGASGRTPRYFTAEAFLELVERAAKGDFEGPSFRQALFACATPWMPLLLLLTLFAISHNLDRMALGLANPESEARLARLDTWVKNRPQLKGAVGDRDYQGMIFQLVMPHLMTIRAK